MRVPEGRAKSWEREGRRGGSKGRGEVCEVKDLEVMDAKRCESCWLWSTVEKCVGPASRGTAKMNPGSRPGLLVSWEL